VIASVVRCAEAAAAATGTRVDIARVQSYKDMRNNQPLARRFGAHLAELGVPFADADPDVGQGSTDMGDVSYVAPSIHPYMAICAPGEAFCHQHAFAAQAASDRGMAAMLAAAKALALTAWDVLTDEELRRAVRAEFAS